MKTRWRLLFWTCLTFAATLTVVAAGVGIELAGQPSFDMQVLWGCLPSFLAPFVLMGIYIIAARKCLGVRSSEKSIVLMIIYGSIFWVPVSFLATGLFSTAFWKGLPMLGHIHWRLAPGGKLDLDALMPAGINLAFTLFFGFAVMGSVVNHLLEVGKAGGDAEKTDFKEPTAPAETEADAMTKVKSGWKLLGIGVLMWVIGYLISSTDLLALMPMGPLFAVGGIGVGLFGLFRLIVGYATKS